MALVAPLPASTLFGRLAKMTPRRSAAGLADEPMRRALEEVFAMRLGPRLRSSLCAILPALLAAALGAASAEAAPQGLALLPTAAPIPFVCDGRDCHAHLATICLQRDRDAPGFGQPYRVAAGSPRLVLRRADGGSVALDAGGLISFAAETSYTAVRASVSRATLAALGGGELAIALEPGIVLAPIESAGDLRPESAADLAFLAGPARDAAIGFFARERIRVAAAEILGRGITRLPEGGHGLDYDAMAAWESALATAARTADPEAVGIARAAARFCRELTIRTCLESSQRELLRPLNRDYWEQLFGS
jgi:hypothetical protein